MRDLVIVLAGRGLQIITALLTLRLLTWRLEQVEMGKLAIFTVLITFFALAFINPVGMYINRQLHAWNRQGTVLRHLGFACSYLILVSGMAALLLYVFAFLFVDLVSIPIGLLIFLVVGSLFTSSINQTIIPSLNLLGKRLEWMLFTLLSLWVGLTASVVLTGIHADAEFWMIGQISGYLLGTGFATASFIAAVNRVHSTEPIKSGIGQIKPVAVFAVPLAITVLLNWFQFQSFRIFFGEMESLARLGIFAAGYAVSAGIMGAFESTAGQYFAPVFYQSLDTADRDKQLQAWQRYASFVIPATILVLVFIVTLSGSLLHLLVDAKYWGAGHFVMIAALLEASRVIGNTYALAGHAIKDTSIMIIPQSVGAGCVLILMPLLMTFFGEPGFLAALVLASLCYVILTRLAVYKRTRLKMKFIDGIEIPVGILLLGMIWLAELNLELDYRTSIVLLTAGTLVCVLTGWRYVVRIRHSRAASSD